MSACSVCGEQGHSMTKCPTLIAPLQPGFLRAVGAAVKTTILFIFLYWRGLKRSTLF